MIAGAVLAAFVQGLSGFAYSLAAMSVWAWTLEPQLAAVLAVFGSLVGQVIAAVTVRRGFSWRKLAPFLAGGLAGLPLGLYIVPRIDMPSFKGLLGLALVILCPLMFFSSRLPKFRGSALGDGVAGAIGGVMGGISGSTGVVPTLWCTLCGYDKDTLRTLMQNFNLALLAITFAGYLASGLVTRPMLPLLAIMVPVMLIPSLVGARLYVGISPDAFRQLVLGLLTASGIALLASALPELWARW